MTGVTGDTGTTVGQLPVGQHGARPVLASSTNWLAIIGRGRDTPTRWHYETSAGTVFPSTVSVSDQFCQAPARPFLLYPVVRAETYAFWDTGISQPNDYCEIAVCQACSATPDLNQVARKQNATVRWMRILGPRFRPRLWPDGDYAAIGEQQSRITLPAQIPAWIRKPDIRRGARVPSSKFPHRCRLCLPIQTLHPPQHRYGRTPLPESARSVL